ncbi:MAG TPA: radical SAM protein [Thermoclostridium caenicola]|uniref:Radical_SAM C-terminal domain-containing protein n=1 Tax=Thermoclostridium caenicola TaxID=659425 RepID=A0A1M6FT90_9FIRM|nr:radical SAM protein [Thermoclostridium caenicola]SHJ00944.1 Radical_SAM C-terminal domain-containing protein [Thermoclostridium caenicola]HOK42720.1 radical SAM protein [Thermoclostridium caenicola]HOL85010.1 radical SAM protein [Thermoclostridium caenicola]HPO77268.1 radical SAM protein [Thermoclostridium caenicola]HPU21930.1 radical SAM protein [Thermoclostridium caenicola]
MENGENRRQHHTAGRHVNIPIFVPHMGCPNTCVFCDQRRISGAAGPAEAENVREIIERFLATSSDAACREIAFFGGSFTGIPRSRMIAYLSVAKAYLDRGDVDSIRLSTRPDYIDRDVLDILKAYGVGVIELGVQSMDDEVLERSRRGHTAEDVEKAVGMIRDYGFAYGIQIMPGLPGDTLEKSLETARKVIELAPGQVRIYPAIVLKGTEMEEMYWKGFYTPLTLEEAVAWCAQMVPMFREAGIRILRLGLHYSELLEDAVVAGPFHPAFGEMVEARIILNQLADIIERNGLAGCEGIEIHTWKGALSKTRGHKKANIQSLKDKYGYREIRVEERELPPGKLLVFALDGRDGS